MEVICAGNGKGGLRESRHKSYFHIGIKAVVSLADHFQVLLQQIPYGDRRVTATLSFQLVDLSLFFIAL